MCLYSRSTRTSAKARCRWPRTRSANCARSGRAQFLDAVESDVLTYIMTERVEPLSKALQTDRKNKERLEWLVWGLHRVSVRGVLSLWL